MTLRKYFFRRLIVYFTKYFQHQGHDDRYEPHLRNKNIEVGCSKFWVHLPNLVPTWNFHDESLLKFPNSQILVRTDVCDDIVSKLIKVNSKFVPGYVHVFGISCYCRFLKFSSTKLTKIPVIFYQQLEIVVLHINLSYRRIVLPAILFYAVSVNVFCTYLTLANKLDLLEHIGNAIFPIMAAETGLALFGFGLIAALANKRSSRCINQMKSAPSSKAFRDGVILKKTVGGLVPLKIRYGNNFVSVYSPLVMNAFCTKGTARLLIMD